MRREPALLPHLPLGNFWRGSPRSATLRRTLLAARAPFWPIRLVDRLPLTGYHPWHAARADLLRRLGRSAEAKQAYDAARELR